MNPHTLKGIVDILKVMRRVERNAKEPFQEFEAAMIASLMELANVSSRNPEKDLYKAIRAFSARMRMHVPMVIATIKMMDNSGPLQ